MAYKIVLDAGHGGEDPGAVYKDRKEKDDNLKLTHCSRKDPGRERRGCGLYQDYRYLSDSF